MTEAQAWRQLAQYVDARVELRHVFLCNEAREQSQFAEVADDMQTRLTRHLGKAFVAYGVDVGDNRKVVSVGSRAEGNEARVLACLWMALEAEDEA